ncbi:MAG: hypothetical protein ACFFD2_21685 [Promethearchaeota archaeon]
MTKINFNKLLDKEVSLTGMAKDAKGGAVLIINEIPIYLKGLLSWSRDYFGKIIKVKGILRDEKIIPDPYIDENGGISQGAIGRQYILENSEILE